MSIELSAPPAPPAPPSRAAAMVLASVVMVFFVAVVVGVVWTAYRHDVVLSDGVIGPAADAGDSAGDPARVAGGPRRPKGGGYSTWSKEHSASNLVPAADLLVTLPAPYGYIRGGESEECICQVIEHFLGQFYDDADVRFIHDESSVVAYVAAMRASDPIPPSERRLGKADVRRFERVFRMDAQKARLAGKDVLLITGPDPGVAHVGRDHVLVVSGATVKDVKRIMRALLEGPNPASAT